MTGDERRGATLLGRRFAEFLIESAAARTSSERDVVEDWESIWSACEDLDPLELAVGRSIVLADELARRIDPSGTRPAVSTASPDRVDLDRSAPVADEAVAARPPSVAPEPPLHPTAAAPTLHVVEAPPPAPVEEPPVATAGTAAPVSPPEAATAYVPEPTADPLAPHPPLPPGLEPVAATAALGVHQATVAVPVAPPPVVPLTAPVADEAEVRAPSLPPTLAGAPSTRAARRQAGARTERRQRYFVGATWLMNVGAVILLFAAWQLWGTTIEHAHAQTSLAAQFRAANHHAAHSGPTLIASTVRVPEPASGTVVAHLQIPSIGVDQYVVEGTGESSLAKGPGHYLGTAMPGQQGNVGIAGHRTTYGAPFNQLDQLAVGNDVILTTLTGESLTYVVARPPVAVSPRDVSVLNDAGDNRLTLTTCNPKYSATQRLVVVATLRKAPPGEVHHRPVHTQIVDTGSTQWNVDYLPATLAATAALVALGLLYQRIKRHLQDARWVILVPLWAGGLFALFVALTGLLPATA